MKINDEKLINAINEKWASKLCPMCGGNNWNIDSGVSGLVALDKNKNVMLGGRVLPVIAITCLHCGNTVLVNPLVVECLDDSE